MTAEKPNIQSKTEKRKRVAEKTIKDPKKRKSEQVLHCEVVSYLKTSFLFTVMHFAGKICHQSETLKVLE